MEEELETGLGVSHGEGELGLKHGVIVRKKRGEGARFRKRFVFTERDQKGLKWIAEQGVATVEQLWWAVWKNAESKSSKYAEERLRDMARGGYIKRERVFGSGTTNYLITQKGRYLVEEAYPDRKNFLPPVPKRVNDGQYRHTMALNWCRLYLEKDSQVINWMSDRAVQSWLKRREYKGSLGDWMGAIDRVSPDACFEYRGERWLFEYEATQKNKTKYEEKAKVLPWSSSEAIQGVIFVAATPGLKAILGKHFKHYRCVIFTREELKQGKVTSFLKATWEKQEEEQRERERYYEQKKREVDAQLPGLKFKLEQLETSRKRHKSEIEAAERDSENAASALRRFEQGFIKLPGQREGLEERVRISNRRLSELRNKDWDLSKEITNSQNEIRKLEQF